MAIEAVGAVKGYPTTSGLGATQSLPRRDEFADKLDAMLTGVNDAQQVADSHLSELAKGGDVDIHGTMIALEEADITLRTMVSVRDKVLEAYKQVMQMSV